MRVLVACENSGVVRDAFTARGHYAISCDLLPDESIKGGPHLIGDALSLLEDPLFLLVLGGQWDMLIAHPPCTYLCSSGLHWNKRVPGRAKKTEEALQMVEKFMSAPIPRIAIENPVGCISTRIRKPDQYIQPYQFGHDASKKTGLWLKNLPPLQPEPQDYVEPRMVDGKPRWGNQTDSGQNKLGPSENRWKLRSKTYKGIAAAMAEQWGNL
jgi:hypothetical protein